MIQSVGPFAVLLAVFCSTAAAIAQAATRPAGWSTRIDDALQTASLENKDTLVWFSGSGWNAASDAVQPALLDAGFVSAAGASFVLVRADFPAGRENERPVDPAYSAWGEKLRVTSLPTLVTLDSVGRPYARAEGPAGDVAACLRLVETLRRQKTERDAAMAAAASLTGVDRARQLDRALVSVGGFAAAWYKPTIAEIVRLDAQNTAGLAAKYQPRLTEANIDQVVQSELYPLLDQSRFDDATALLDRLLIEAKPTLEQKQLLMAFKAQIAYSNGDHPRAIKLLDEAHALDATTPAAARVAKAREQIIDSPPPPKRK
ncbi:MAG TPA: hypothetical protein VF624_10190 [Tepidisphaeraceae bacterium]|jgi:hypothetical protein